MDWSARCEEIQARYFRKGPYTCLTIGHDPLTDIVDWCFTFADLGMYHIIESRACVTRTPAGVFSVNREEAQSENEALARVFAGHYIQFLIELYADAGFKP